MIDNLEKKIQIPLEDGNDLLGPINSKVKEIVNIDFSEFGEPDELQKKYLIELQKRNPIFFNKLRNNIYFNGNEIGFYVKGEEINYIFKGRVNKWYNFIIENNTEKTSFEYKNSGKIPYQHDFTVLEYNFTGKEDFKELFKIFNIKYDENSSLSDFYKFLREIHYHSTDDLDDMNKKESKEAFYLLLDKN